MQDINESIAVLQARAEGRQIECQKLDKKDAAWMRISATHPFDFGTFRYRVIVFPEVTWGIYAINEGQMNPQVFTNPAKAVARLAEIAAENPGCRLTLVRVVECGQSDEALPRVPVAVEDEAAAA